MGRARLRDLRVGGACAAAAGAVLAAPTGAAAAPETFTVSTTADPGDGSCDATCSLRDALLEAAANNNPPDLDRILFASSVSGTINVAGSQLPAIDQPLSVAGPGASALTVEGGAGFRALYVNTGLGDPVTVSGLTLSGRVNGEGGAIFHDDAQLTLRQVTVTGSETTGPGNDGGGIYSREGGLTIEGSTIAGNVADGIAAEGGGIYAFDEGVIIRRSTISGNSVSGPAGKGGALMGNTVALEVESSTISGNAAREANSEGGGIFMASAAGDPTLENTIVANNTATVGGPDLRGPAATFRLSFSLVEDVSGALTANAVPGSNILGVDPKLASLADNGGRTRTHALRPGSPALDRGAASGADQRGSARPFDYPTVPNSAAVGANGADIGAFELSGRCSGKPATVPGLIGTGRRDVIAGTPRSDRILGKGRRDLVCAGRGRDRVSGGGGNDVLRGERGNDRLRGQGGRDRLLGGPGRDRLLGGGALDALIGGPGRDVQRQ